MSLSDSARWVLGAAVALGGLQFALVVALYATRVPALIKARVRPQRITKETLAGLPSLARNVADNYNNLFEAPTLFFALSLILAVSGGAGAFDAICAWGYVALRLAHSIVQTTVNIIMVRFSLFVASWAVLGVMLVRSALALVQ